MKGKHDNFQAVVLAAGQGKRMGEAPIPKVLFPLHDRPMILHLFDEIERILGGIKPVAVVGYKREMVMDALGSRASYAIQEEQLGTAHAVLCARTQVAAKNIVVLYGDMPFISGESIDALVSTHETDGAKLTMYTAIAPTFDGQYGPLFTYGRIIRDRNGSIKRIVELKDATDEEKEIREVNPGIYCFDSEWLWGELAKIGNANNQHEYYLTDVIEVAIRDKAPVATVLIEPTEVFGINTRDHLAQAHELVRSPRESVVE